ncbi:hypothetical protein J7L67_04475 [bacterium]|nr:hypothetical protein [bacterium]
MIILYKYFFKYILSAVLISLFIYGCAGLPSSLKGSLSGTVLYTDCPPDKAFDAACKALAKLGYAVDIKNDFNYFARGVCIDSISKKKNFYVHIQVEPQPVGSKIISRLDEFHDTSTFKFFGIYTRLANELANEILSSLTKRNYSVQRL